MPRTIEFWRK